jgi:Na+-driven multidrug efflux pump
LAKEPFAAKLTSLWIGGFFCWIIKGFNGKLINQYEEKYDNRNVWTGYFITLILIGIVVYFLVRDEIEI